MRRWIRIVTVLTVALLAGAACAGSPSAAKATPSPPPNGVAALELVDRSTMQDGHVRVTLRTAGFNLSGEGWISLRPRMAQYTFLTGTWDGDAHFDELLMIGSVQYKKSGQPAERATARWERTIGDRIMTSPSEYVVGVPKTSDSIRSGVREDVVAGARAWLVQVDLPGDLEEQVWLRASDGYLMQLRVSDPAGNVNTITVDKYNVKPSIAVPSDVDVDEGAVTCGPATTTTPLKSASGLRLCGLEGLSSTYETFDFATVTNLPESLRSFVVDYAATESRPNEGVALTDGAAVFSSESWEHEVDLLFLNRLSDVAVVVDYVQTGGADASMVGVALRCSSSEKTAGRGCLLVEVRPNGQWVLAELPPGGSTYKYPIGGYEQKNAGQNRLVVWAHGNEIGVALNGILLATYRTSNLDPAMPFFFHRSLSKTEPSQVRLLSLGIYQPKAFTLTELMGA